MLDLSTVSLSMPDTTTDAIGGIDIPARFGGLGAGREIESEVVSEDPNSGAEDLRIPVSLRGSFGFAGGAVLGVVVGVAETVA